MTWDVDLVLVLRVIINDFNTPQKNTDSYLQRVLVTAGILMKQEIQLSFDYTFDISNVTISPDPIEEDDSVLQALLPLKAACVINQGEFRTAIGQGIKVKDGDSSIDTSVSFRGYRDILELGPCAAYDKLRWQIQAANAPAIGAVLSPFRGPNEIRPTLESISFYYDTIAGVVTSCRENSRF